MMVALIVGFALAQSPIVAPTVSPAATPATSPLSLVLAVGSVVMVVLAAAFVL